MEAQKTVSNRFYLFKRRFFFCGGPKTTGSGPGSNCAKLAILSAVKCFIYRLTTAG